VIADPLHSAQNAKSEGVSVFRAEFLARCTLAAGVPVTDDMLDWCMKSGYVSKPASSVGRRRYSESHIQEMLDHIATRGRQIPAEAKRLIAKAAELRRRKNAGADPQTNLEGSQ